MTGRPPGPIRKYTVEQIWPNSPGRWRSCVSLADERMARRSATAVLRFRYAMRLKIDFLKPGTENHIVDRIVAAEWDRQGNIIHSYSGPMLEFVPEWVFTLTPAEAPSKVAA